MCTGIFCSPLNPYSMDWSEIYPDFCSSHGNNVDKKLVEFADIGCGYGGLLGEFSMTIHSTIKF